MPGSLLSLPGRYSPCLAARHQASLAYIGCCLVSVASPGPQPFSRPRLAALLHSPSAIFPASPRPRTGFHSPWQDITETLHPGRGQASLRCLAMLHSPLQAHGKHLVVSPCGLAFGQASFAFSVFCWLGPRQWSGFTRLGWAEARPRTGRCSAFLTVTLPWQEQASSVPRSDRLPGFIASLAFPWLSLELHSFTETCCLTRAAALALAVVSELIGFSPRIDRIFPSSTSKQYLKG